MPKKFDREPVAWITRGGKHVPIFEGEAKKFDPNKLEDDITKLSEGDLDNYIEAKSDKLFQQYERQYANSSTDYLKLDKKIKIYKLETINPPPDLRVGSLKDGEQFLGFTNGKDIYIRQKLNKTTFITVLKHEIKHIWKKDNIDFSEEYPDKGDKK